MRRSGSPSTISAPNSARSRPTSPPTLPTVTGVRDYLTQVVLNLVLNAIDATDDQGRIHVAARAEDGWLVLTVEDDGRGISIADRCRLFQPFFTTKAHGTGLGLFVSRQILEDHAGTLSFRSEPGQGSTFIVRLPAEPRDTEQRRRDSSFTTANAERSERDVAIARVSHDGRDGRAGRRGELRRRATMKSARGRQGKRRAQSRASSGAAQAVS